MEPLDTEKLKEIYHDNNDLEMALRRAKVAISASRNVSSDAMNDAECIAFSQAIFIAEQARRNSDQELGSASRKLLDKAIAENIKECIGLPPEEILSNIPQYNELSKKHKESKQSALNLFKQALLRKPNDEQLRLLCAASILNQDGGINKITCINILEDPAIALNTALSTRIIDAAVQWRQALNVTDKNDDSDVLGAFIAKNFSEIVMVMSTSDQFAADDDFNKHPSYERGIHLLRKIGQSMENGSITPDAGIELLNVLDRRRLKSAFKNSSQFAKAYNDLEDAYIRTYMQKARNNLNKSLSHQLYESAMQKTQKLTQQPKERY